MNAPQPHTSCCAQCSGTGHDIDLAGDGDIDVDAGTTCTQCDGSGAARWEWAADEDDGECEFCGDRGVALMRLGVDGEDWACWPCVRASHTVACGCVAEGWVA